MGPKSIDNDDDDDDRTVHSNRVPLLDKTSNKDGRGEVVVNPKISDDPTAGVSRKEMDLAIMEQIGPHHNYYATGQWVWLYLAWSIMGKNLVGMRRGESRFFYVFDAIAGFLILIVHGFFLIKLSQSPGRNPLRLAQVNQETLPAILSGLRVFGLVFGNIEDSAIQFLVHTAVVFLLCEVLFGSFGGCFTSDKSRSSNEEGRILNNMEAGFDSSIPIRLFFDHAAKVKHSWSAIEHWAWIFFAWTGTVLYDPRLGGMDYLDADSDLMWAMTPPMVGHGLLFAIPFIGHGKRPSISGINRENLPAMLSSCLFISMADTADQLLVTVATFVLLSQVLWNICRFVHSFFLTKVFATFVKMENEYFEVLKENEAEEAAQLEKQMERMAYLESRPRSKSAKGRRKQRVLVLYVVLALFYYIQIFHDTSRRGYAI